MFLFCVTFDMFLFKNTYICYNQYVNNRFNHYIGCSDNDIFEHRTLNSRDINLYIYHDDNHGKDIYTLTDISTWNISKKQFFLQNFR